MRFTRTGLVLVTLLGLGLGRPARAADSEQLAEDEQRLKTAKLGTDGPALQAFFRIRTRPSAEPEAIAALVKQMGNDSDKVSSKATREIISLGQVTVPWLRRSLKDPDDELAARRAKFCLDSIEGSEGASLTISAARLLALRRPPRAVKTLLDYLPFADDDTVVEEVREALTTLAVTDGKADEYLVAALKSDLPICRAVAAEALCQANAGAEFATVRYLLQDPKPTVRLRAAVALANVKEKDAVPVLIEVLGKLSPELARPAEEALQRLAGVQAPSVPLGKDEATRKRCRDSWNTWWTSIKDKDLLGYFRKHTLADADQEKFLGMMKLLGSDSFQVRRNAIKQLAGYRSAALPLLRQALTHTDAEIKKNAAECLTRIKDAPLAGFSATNARLLGVRKPEGAVDVLLAYLPFADDDSVGEEVRNALSTMAIQDGRPNRKLLTALRDRSPARRAAAAEALLQAGVAQKNRTLAGLLKDPETPVRLRVALALAAVHEKASVPVLIDLLTQLSADDAWQAEEVLRRIAGDKAPELVLGADEASRKKAHTAWAAWWKTNGARLKLGQATGTARLLGYTVILQYNNNGFSQVYELGRNGKQRWSIDNLSYAFDVQVLRGERILIAEYNGNRVTERDFKGKIIWEKGIQYPMNVQRLPNGNTFMASRNQLIEYDPKKKKDVFSIQRPSYDIRWAQKMRNGKIAILTSNGTIVTFDPKTQKELKSISVGNVNYYAGMEVLANGHFLVAQYNTNKVVEYDAKGKIVWQATAQWPTTVSRLPNGRTLVVSQDTQKVIEIDRNGKEVWSHTTSGRPWRALRR